MFAATFVHSFELGGGWDQRIAGIGGRIEALIARAKKNERPNRESRAQAWSVASTTSSPTKAVPTTAPTAGYVVAHSCVSYELVRVVGISSFATRVVSELVESSKAAPRQSSRASFSF